MEETEVKLPPSLGQSIMVRKGVELFSSMYWLCGRIMAKIERDTGIDGFNGWMLVGGVYSKFNPPTNLRDLLFIPWLLPIPTINSVGTISVELYVQVSEDIESTIQDTEKPVSGSYLGEIKYMLITKRSVGYVRANVHVGELRGTHDPQQYIINLHSLPFLLAEPDPRGRIHPMMVLIAQRPVWAFRKKRLAERRKREADKRIMQGDVQ